VGTLSLLVVVGIAVSVSTDCHRKHRPDLLITAADATPVRSLAVSPWSARVVSLACFLGAVGCGEGSWRWGWWDTNESIGAGTV
ncbi:MAG: hypothetical protein GY832_47070, partial [Chloroflexi bacterium]|nr:hypothetical protein [Chloroflexota bacterium]